MLTGNELMVLLKDSGTGEQKLAAVRAIVGNNPSTDSVVKAFANMGHGGTVTKCNEYIAQYAKNEPQFTGGTKSPGG